MRFYIEVKNNLGSFCGDILEGSQEQYDNLLLKLSTFYDEPGYEMILDNGTHFMIGSDMLKQSIILVHKIQNA